MPIFTDSERGKRLEEQYDLGNCRLRMGSPVAYDRTRGVRPLDLGEDDHVDAIVLRKEQHPGNQILHDVNFDVEDDKRVITPSDEYASHPDHVTVYLTDRMVPICRLDDGDTVHLRAVTEDCDAYTGDGDPTFEEFETVALVPDGHSIDGARLAPLDDVDQRRNHIVVGGVSEMKRHKRSTSGYDETVTVTVDVTV